MDTLKLFPSSNTGIRSCTHIFMVLHFRISGQISCFTVSKLSTNSWLLFSITLGITNTMVPWKASTLTQSSLLGSGIFQSIVAIGEKNSQGPADSCLSGSELGYICLGLVLSKNCQVLTTALRKCFPPSLLPQL